MFYVKLRQPAQGPPLGGLLPNFTGVSGTLYLVRLDAPLSKNDALAAKIWRFSCFLEFGLTFWN